MAETFFMQAVSHALDRYAQRSMQKEQLDVQERMAGAELKEKYYYADIVRKSNEAQAENDRARLAIAERAQRLQEDQSNINNEMVPLQKFKGVPGMIMQGFSPDGKSVRRGDVPAMMQSYIGWLQATKLNQAETWRMGMVERERAENEKNRGLTWALLNAARSGGATNVPPFEQQVKDRNNAVYTATRAAGDVVRKVVPGQASLPIVNDLVNSVAFSLHPDSGDHVLPDERSQYSAAAGEFDRQFTSIGKTLDAFGDPRVNAQVTPEMAGILARSVDAYTRLRPTLSRFAGRAIMNTLDAKAKRIHDVVAMQQYPELWKNDLELARTRLQGEYGLQREELKRR